MVRHFIGSDVYLEAKQDSIIVVSNARADGLEATLVEVQQEKEII